jgi:hypothetical protein
VPPRLAAGQRRKAGADAVYGDDVHGWCDGGAALELAGAAKW